MLLKYFKTLTSKVKEYDVLFKKGANNPFIDKKMDCKKPKEQIYLWIDKEC